MTTTKIKTIKTPKKIEDSNSKILLNSIKKGKNKVTIVSHNSEIQMSFGNADKSITDFLQSLTSTTPTFSIRYLEGLDFKDNLQLVNNLTQDKDYFGLNTSWVTESKKTHLEFQFIKTRNTKKWSIGTIVNNVMEQLESRASRVIIEIPYHWIDKSNLENFGIKFIAIMDTIAYQVGNENLEIQGKKVVDSVGRYTQDFYFMNNRGIHIPKRNNQNKSMVNGYMDLEGHRLTKEMETYLKLQYETFLEPNTDSLQALFTAYAPRTNESKGDPSEDTKTHKTIFTKEHKDIDVENSEKNKKDEFYFKINSHDWFKDYISQYEIISTTNKVIEKTTKDELETFIVTEYKFKDLKKANQVYNFYSTTMLKENKFKNVASLK